MLSGLVVVLGVVLRDEVAACATVIVDTLGAFGVFVGVFASDVFGIPVPPSTYVFAAIASDSPTAPILIIAIITSIFGGSIAYFIGPYIGKIPFLNTQLERFRPRGEGIFDRWGIWAVGAAALTPLPFSLCCWLAGIYRMPFGRFFTATLMRGPRLMLYYGLFLLGWTGAASL